MHTVHGCTWGLEQGSYVRFKTEVTCGIQDRCNIHMRFRTGVHTHGVQSRDGMHRGFRTEVHTHGVQSWVGVYRGFRTGWDV